jgi:hypothetical protein
VRSRLRILYCICFFAFLTFFWSRLADYEELNKYVRSRLRTLLCIFVYAFLGLLGGSVLNVLQCKVLVRLAPAYLNRLTNPMNSGKLN